MYSLDSGFANLSIRDSSLPLIVGIVLVINIGILTGFLRFG